MSDNLPHELNMDTDFLFRPIQLLSINDKSSIELNKDGVESIYRIFEQSPFSNQVIVISLYGPAGVGTYFVNYYFMFYIDFIFYIASHVGKSTLLGVLIRAFTPKGDTYRAKALFETGVYQDTVTRGCWIYDGLLQVTSNDGNVYNVILLDMQGYGTDTGNDCVLETIRLFMPCAIVSDVTLVCTKNSGLRESDIAEFDKVLYNIKSVKDQLSSSKFESYQLHSSVAELCFVIPLLNNVPLKHGNKRYDGTVVGDYIRDFMFHPPQHGRDDQRRRLRRDACGNTRELLHGLGYPLSNYDLPQEIMRDLNVLADCTGEKTSDGYKLIPPKNNDRWSSEDIKEAGPLIDRMSDMVNNLIPIMLAAHSRKVIFGKTAGKYWAQEFTLLLTQSASVVANDEFIEISMTFADPLVKIMMQDYCSVLSFEVESSISQFFEDYEAACRRRNMDTADGADIGTYTSEACNISDLEHDALILLDHAKDLQDKFAVFKSKLTMSLSNCRITASSLFGKTECAMSAILEDGKLQKFLESGDYRVIVDLEYKSFLEDSFITLNVCEEAILENVAANLGKSISNLNEVAKHNDAVAESMQMAAQEIGKYTKIILDQQAKMEAQWRQQIEESSRANRAKAKSRSFFKKFVGAVVGVAVGVFFPPVLIGAGLSSGLGIAAVTGATASAAGAAASGAKGSQVWKAAGRGLVTGGVTNAIGSALPAATTGATGVSAIVPLRVASHSLAGGAISSAFGGICVHLLYGCILCLYLVIETMKSCR